ncbi:MAG: hypothetical protein K9N23_22110 [Akkermansiaceae bacterium]|nr:hypothetical protein [Akkermansiaceae bacterium]MCF7734393.1 hypothetical protein [Akkermansiaceae bacterium]
MTDQQNTRLAGLLQAFGADILGEGDLAAGTNLLAVLPAKREQEGNKECEGGTEAPTRVAWPALIRSVALVPPAKTSAVVVGACLIFHPICQPAAVRTGCTIPERLAMV